ncbi:MAG: amidohydrolase family protein [Bacteroidota bacterium]
MIKFIWELRDWENNSKQQLHMRIDAHQHFWIYNPASHGWINDEMAVIRKDFMPDDLMPILNTHRIDGCIAVQADESMHENELLLKLADKYSFIKGVVGWANLGAPAFNEQIPFFKQFKKLVGFRCIMQGKDDELYLKNEIFIQHVASLSKWNYTYDLLVYHHQIPSLHKFVERLTDNKLMLDHIGKPDIKQKNFQSWKENIQQLAQHPNIYCKLSGMITEADYTQWKYEDIVPYMDAIGEAFGAERICFGSDWPVCLVAASYDKMIGVVERWSSQFSTNEQDKIFGLNSIKFYNL